MTHLVKKVCEVVKPDEDPLEGDDLTHYQAQIHSEWEVVDGRHLRRKFLFPGYDEALEFTNTVAEIAQTEGHHPDIYLSYGVVKVVIKTHEIDGLHENDFVVAAKIDRQHQQDFPSN